MKDCHHHWTPVHPHILRSDCDFSSLSVLSKCLLGQACKMYSQKGKGQVLLKIFKDSEIDHVNLNWSVNNNITYSKCGLSAGSTENVILQWEECNIWLLFWLVMTLSSDATSPWAVVYSGKWTQCCKVSTYCMYVIYLTFEQTTSK